MYEGGYLDHETLTPADFDRMIDGYMATCVVTGIYCILDWHVHHPGNPLYYTDQAKLFFDKFSKKYAHLPNCGCAVQPAPNAHAAWLLMLAGVFGLRRRARPGEITSLAIRPAGSPALHSSGASHRNHHSCQR